LIPTVANMNIMASLSLHDAGASCDIIIAHVMILHTTQIVAMIVKINSTIGEIISLVQFYCEAKGSNSVLKSNVLKV